MRHAHGRIDGGECPLHLPGPALRVDRAMIEEAILREFVKDGKIV